MHGVRVTIACAIVLLAVAPGTAQAGSVCRDGTWTPSEGSGTCSRHGGIGQRGVPAPAGATSSGGAPTPGALTPPDPLPLPSATTPTLLPPPAGVLLPKAVTPGVIDSRVTQANLATTICRSGYTTTVRPPSSYTTSLKRRQLATTYADFSDKRTGSYEEDHLISLELGGHPTDPGNLWPEPYAGSTGARVKDRVENRLHQMVCAGSISLARAQREIATNWWDAYQRYVG